MRSRLLRFLGRFLGPTLPESAARRLTDAQYEAVEKLCAENPPVVTYPSRALAGGVYGPTRAGVPGVDRCRYRSIDSLRCVLGLGHRGAHMFKGGSVRDQQEASNG